MPSSRPVVYVTGHRNPDTDSIASAIGYAVLKGGSTVMH
jgi:inorganic pyrophosphatase/exopolyphosphatase